ncbi:uncharacterized protein LOC144548359 [Carex rostrata]
MSLMAPLVYIGIVKIDVIDKNTLERLVPTPTKVEGQIAVPVEGEAHEAPLQHTTLRARCLLGVTHGGNAALHIATHFGRREVAEAICVKNVSLLMKDNDMLETPLHYAAKAGRSNIVTHFIQLANSGANNIDLGEMLTKRNRDGETALYQAVLYNHPAVVINSFLHARANPYVSQLLSIPNSENIYPLYLAILQQNHDIVSSLIHSLRGRGDVSQEAYAGPNGQTALHAVVLNSRGKTGCKSYLII